MVSSTRLLAARHRALDALGLPLSVLCAIARRVSAGSRELAGVARVAAGFLRPYRGQLAVVLVALAVDTVTSLAAPWPLKIIVDHVVGARVPPGWLRQAADLLPGGGAVALAELAALVVVIAAALGALASYVSEYCTERVGQSVGQDVRLRLYHHLQHGGLCLRPPWSMVEHIGFDAEATNAGNALGWNNPPLRVAPRLSDKWSEPAENAACRQLWGRANPGGWRQLWRRIRIRLFHS